MGIIVYAASADGYVRRQIDERDSTRMAEIRLLNLRPSIGNIRFSDQFLLDAIFNRNQGGTIPFAVLNQEDQNIFVSHALDVVVEQLRKASEADAPQSELTTYLQGFQMEARNYLYGMEGYSFDRLQSFVEANSPVSVEGSSPNHGIERRG